MDPMNEPVVPIPTPQQVQDEPLKTLVRVYASVWRNDDTKPVFYDSIRYHPDLINLQFGREQRKQLGEDLAMIRRKDNPTAGELALLSTFINDYIHYWGACTDTKAAVAQAWLQNKTGLYVQKRKVRVAGMSEDDRTKHMKKLSRQSKESRMSRAQLKEVGLISTLEELMIADKVPLNLRVDLLEMVTRKYRDSFGPARAGHLAFEAFLRSRDESDKPRYTEEEIQDALARRALATVKHVAERKQETARRKKSGSASTAIQQSPATIAPESMPHGDPSQSSSLLASNMPSQEHLHATPMPDAIHHMYSGPFVADRSLNHPHRLVEEKFYPEHTAFGPSSAPAQFHSLQNGYGFKTSQESWTLYERQWYSYLAQHASAPQQPYEQEKVQLISAQSPSYLQQSARLDDVPPPNTNFYLSPYESSQRVGSSSFPSTSIPGGSVYPKQEQAQHQNLASGSASHRHTQQDNWEGYNLP